MIPQETPGDQYEADLARALALRSEVLENIEMICKMICDVIERVKITQSKQIKFRIYLVYKSCWIIVVVANFLQIILLEYSL